MVRGSDRTKHAHTSVCCSLWLDMHQLLVNIWRKEWLKQDISSGLPVGGPARVSLQPGVGPKENSPVRGQGCRETGGKLGWETKKNLHCCCPYWLDCMHKKLTLTNKSIIALFFPLSLSSVPFFFYLSWFDLRWQLSSTLPPAQLSHTPGETGG